MITIFYDQSSLGITIRKNIIYIFNLSWNFCFYIFFLLKNKCLSVKEVNLEKVNFPDPENIAIMNVECGNVVIELYPEISPNSVERFKTLINKGLYLSLIHI